MDINEDVSLVCSGCGDLTEFVVASVTQINDSSAERVWECCDCGHAEIETIASP